MHEEKGQGMDMEQVSLLEENCISKIEKYKEKAYLGHLETKKVMREARRTLADSDVLKGEEEAQTENGISARNDKDAQKTVLENTYKLIEDYISENKNTNVNKSRPRIKNIEKMNIPFSFSLLNQNVRTDKPSTF